MATESTTILTYVPVSSVWHLPVGIAHLAAVLEADGQDVVQRYAHIEGVEFVLRQQDRERTSEALRVVRDPSTGILGQYAARITFEEISAAIPTPDTFAVERNNVRYTATGYRGRIRELVAAVDEREHHLFHRYFAEVEVPFAVSRQPALYGISISDERQFVNGVILASMVKEALGPSTLVVLGGNVWARVRAAFGTTDFTELFRFCDAIVAGEGPEPIRALARDRRPDRAPSVVWLDGDRVRVNPATTPVDFNALPTPIFDRETVQWSPDFVPPLYTMSNCPMQCSFCAIAAGSDTFLGKPRSMDETVVAKHMIGIGARRFDIQDEFLTLQRQLRLGEALRREGYEATWQCYLTATDRLLDPSVCERLYDAGCRAVQIGLESLDPDTLASEAKHWNHPANYGRILSNLADVGIQTHVFIIVGCPTEPINWSLRWLAFLEDHGESILTIKASRYRLTRRAPDERLAQTGGLAGIAIHEGPDEALLSLNRDQFNYTQHKLSRKKVEAIRDLLEQACREHWAYQVTSTIPWWINRGRYTLDELREMAAVLAETVPRETPVSERQLKLALTKISTALSDELGLRQRLANYEDALDASRSLFV